MQAWGMLIDQNIKHIKLIKLFFVIMQTRVMCRIFIFLVFVECKNIYIYISFEYLNKYPQMPAFT